MPEQHQLAQYMPSAPLYCLGESRRIERQTHTHTHTELQHCVALSSESSTVWMFRIPYYKHYHEQLCNGLRTNRPRKPSVPDKQASTEQLPAACLSIFRAQGPANKAEFGAGGVCSARASGAGAGAGVIGAADATPVGGDLGSTVDQCEAVRMFILPWSIGRLRS